MDVQRMIEDKTSFRNAPIIVDLDGTLIYSDMLYETALSAVIRAPLVAFKAPSMLSKGKAFLKQQFAQRAAFDPLLLPYNEDLIAWLKEQRIAGRPLVLCTASDRIVADKIAEHLGIFDDVMASDGTCNLSGDAKAKALVKRFGVAGYDYVGNSNADLPVWSCAHRAIIVNASNDLIQKTKEISSVEKIFQRQKSGISTWMQMVRAHQWLKNSLIFIPLLAAHELTNKHNWISLILAFFAFSLCASSVYISNDLLDLASDRAHPRKRARPFASGLINLWQGALLAPVLLSISFIIAWFVGKPFISCIAIYFILTCAYSWRLKRLVLIDCLTLALLYTLRIIAGAVAIHMVLSFWLLAFSIFLFLSLSFVKRYAELELNLLTSKERLHGRGYHTTDAPVIQTMGIASGYASALVLSLYLNSDAVIKMYAAPKFIWGAVPVLLFWISWMWMQAHRGKMHDDPLVFAVKDRASLAAGLVFAGVIFVGATGVSW